MFTGNAGLLAGSQCASICIWDDETFSDFLISSHIRTLFIIPDILRFTLTLTTASVASNINRTRQYNDGHHSYIALMAWFLMIIVLFEIIYWLYFFNPPFQVNFQYPKETSNFGTLRDWSRRCILGSVLWPNEPQTMHKLYVSRSDWMMLLCVGDL